MTDKLITVTSRALRKAVSVRSEEPDGDKLALFLEVGDPGGFEYSYDLYLDDLANARPGDHVQDEDGMSIVIPRDSIDHVRGATLDLSKNLLNPGWVVDNPNSPSPAVGQHIAPSELTGNVEERVQQVLEMVINPSIASHGGRADLVRVEEGVAYLQLSGGCQGCGMAKVTLSQGIEVSLREAVPEITGVADVTDHESGESPYFASSKK
jgi:Fe/S biogenesis protein NfuA